MLGPCLDVAYNKKRFLEVFPVVVEELLDTLRAESMPDEIIEWYRRVCLCSLLLFSSPAHWLAIYYRTWNITFMEVCFAKGDLV
jgi:hypothetical protein